MTNTKKAAVKFGQDVVIQARGNLAPKLRRKPLWESINFKYKEFPNSFALTINMADYGKFHDQGVKGHGRGDWTPKRPKQQQAQGSPFQFRTGPGKNTILKSMVNKSTFRTRDLDTGQFIPKTDQAKNTAAFLIARSIGRYGTPSTYFMTNAIKKNSKTFVKSLGKAFVADQDKFIQGLQDSYIPKK